MSGALDGLRVLDFTQMMAGPMCTMLLGDFGADVIKIESPEGDAMRKTGDTMIGGETEFYLSLNRNKRSIVIDLRTEEGRAQAHAFIRTADIMVENFRPGTAERLGIGYEDACQINPRLIYCSMSGFGREGDARNRPALDPVIQAMSGMMQLTGTQESGPLRTGFALADFVTPMFALSGILAGLQARNASNRGQRVDLTMLNATIFSMVPREGYYFATGKTPQRIGNSHYQLVPYNTYTTSDDRQIFLLAHNPKFWSALTKALDAPDLAADPRFATSKGRIENRDPIDQRLADIVKQRPLAEWEKRLSEAGALFSLVRTLDEVFSDPGVKRDMVVEIEHPVAGSISVLANPLQFSDTPATIRRYPPRLGEHTQELLAELNVGERR